MILQASLSDKELTSKISSICKVTKKTDTSALMQNAVEKGNSIDIHSVNINGLLRQVSDWVSENFRHCMTAVSDAKAVNRSRTSDMQNEAIKLIKDTEASIKLLTSKRPNVNPFNCSIFMEHNFDCSVPNHIITVAELHNSLLLFGKIKNETDFENTIEKVTTMDLSQEKVFRNLFNVSDAHPVPIDFILRKKFFPGIVPDFAKLYIDTVYDYVKDFNTLSKNVKGFKFEELAKNADAYMDSVAKTLKTANDTIQNLYDTLPQNLAERAFRIYIGLLSRYMIYTTNAAIITLMQGQMCMLAYIDKFKSFYVFR